ncbi:MAG: metallophosphoesterase family protein [Flavobacteriales bacterium]|nr:metallophosphoesterase family protein [Flavobacteriales bacterium]
MKYLIISCFSLLFFQNVYAKARFVRVTFGQNPYNEASIIWDQNRGEFLGLYLDTVEPSVNRYRNVLQLSDKNSMRGMKNHIVRLKGLKPNTRYYFTIKDTEGFGRTYYFSTVSDSPNERFSFIAGGDSRDNRVVRQKADKLVAKLKAHAVLFNGDFTGIDIEKQWKEWFLDWENSIDTDGRITPLIVTRGNHEHSNKVIVALFDVPHKKVFYNTVFGGNLLNLVSLNSEIQKVGPQKIFLRNTLAEHDSYQWQIVQYHRPVRAHVASKKEMQTQYKNFVPLFEKHKNVRLCLENDSHTWKVTWPIVSSKDSDADEGFKRDDAKGIVYAGEGTWGAPLRAADDKKSWTRDAEAINQFNWIFVSKEKIELRTIKYENEAEVESLTEKNRFQMPKNIELYGPVNGTLVEIFPR